MSTRGAALALAWLGAGALLAVGACEGRASPPPAVAEASREASPIAPRETARAHGPADPAAIARGAALFERLECGRCHAREGARVEAAADCAGCHRAIRDGSFAREGVTPELAARFRANVRHYVEIPSLDHVDGFLDRAWIAGYLRAPHDLRPRLDETMPALPLGEADARDLAAYLAPSPVAASEAPPSDEASIERGRSHFDRLGCAGCHARGGRAATDVDAPALAPDLAHVRDRVLEGALLAFLLDPAAMRPGTAMPRLVRDPAVARELAAFLVHAPIEPGPVASAVARLPPLDRPVTFDEVEERVLRRSCWHCHADESLVYGDGGPGNTGGFGFAPREVDLSSYPHVQAGALDRDGARASLFREVDGEPLLLRVLVARQDEERGVVSDHVRGMPLGLPSLSAEQIQLVESWIAQGRPR
jgi:cytochrome c2